MRMAGSCATSEHGLGLAVRLPSLACSVQQAWLSAGSAGPPAGAAVLVASAFLPSDWLP